MRTRRVAPASSALPAQSMSQATPTSQAMASSTTSARATRTRRVAPESSTSPARSMSQATPTAQAMASSMTSASAMRTRRVAPASSTSPARSMSGHPYRVELAADSIFCKLGRGAGPTSLSVVAQQWRPGDATANGTGDRSRSSSAASAPTSCSSSPPRLGQREKGRKKNGEDTNRETRKENESILQKMLIVSTQNDAKFAAITSDMLTAVKDSHLLDSESRMRIETVFATSSDHLEMLDTKHSQGTESIRSMTTKCLERDYKANSPVRRRPGELMSNAYSLESIDQLRAPVPDLVVKFRSENNLDEVDKGKRYVDQGTRTPRSPLMPVNHYNKS